MKRGKTNPIQRTTPGGGSYGGNFQPRYSTQIFNCYKKQPKSRGWQKNVGGTYDGLTN